MYCSLNEAWGNTQQKKYITDDEYAEFQKFKNNKIEHFENSNNTNANANANAPKQAETNANAPKQAETNGQQKITISQHIEDPTDKHVCDCDNVLEHIHNCPICLKKIYKKYACMMPIDGLFNDIMTKENKETLSIILIGILVILILQLLKD